MRIPFDDSLVVTPWTPPHGPAGPSLLASGRDVSPTGVAFWHSEQIPWRYAAISLPGDGLDEEGELVVETVLVRLVWCRFLRRGRYLSGGQFEEPIGSDFARPLAQLFGLAEVRPRTGLAS